MSTGRKAGAKKGAAEPRKKPPHGVRAKSAPAKEVRAEKKPHARATPDEIMARLTRAIPDPQCELAFHNPFQLLIATILSAQSTDKAVNAVTPALFSRFPTPAALAAAPPEEVEALIKRTGFFRAKTKSIMTTAQLLVTQFEGEVPQTLEELTRLKGVARKTANVVLGTAFGIASGFVVDTHVTCVSQRLGLTQEQDPAKIERDLCEAFPRERWVDMGHRVLLHGRYTCLAKAPKCEVCPLYELCPSRMSERVEGDLETRSRGEAARVREGMAAALPA